MTLFTLPSNFKLVLIMSISIYFNSSLNTQYSQSYQALLKLYFLFVCWFACSMLPRCFYCKFYNHSRTWTRRIINCIVHCLTFATSMLNKIFCLEAFFCFLDCFDICYVSIWWPHFKSFPLFLKVFLLNSNKGYWTNRLKD